VQSSIGDVRVFPADSAAADAAGVGLGLVAVLEAADAVAGAFVADAPELFDVDVDQLTGHLPFVALGGLETDAAELAHPDPRKDLADRRQGHVQRLGDLRAGKA
jgi:hypothetical protein